MSVVADRSIFSHVRWTYLFVVANGVLQIGMLAVTARLLSPADFGLLATALLVIKAAQVLVQSGYERAIVWSSELCPSQVCGMFWVSIATGSALGLLCAALAGAVAETFAEPALITVSTWLALMIPMSSLGLTSRGLLRREMRFKELGLAETISYTTGFIIVGLPLAIYGFGIWSLVAANIVQATAQGLLPLAMRRHAVFLSFSLREIKTPLRFGYGVSGLGILELFDSQATPASIARFLGMDALGIYSRVYSLIQLPLEQLGTSLTRVLFSSFSRDKDNKYALTSSALLALKLLAGLIIPLGFGAAAASKPLISVVLGERWASSSEILPFLAIAASFAVLGNLVATLNEALGVIRQKAQMQIAVTILLVGSLLSFGKYGLLQASLCFCVAKILFFIAQIFLTGKSLSIGLTRFLRALAPGLAVGTMCALAIILVQANLSHTFGALISLCLSILTGVLVVVPALIALLPEVRNAIMRLKPSKSLGE